MKKTKLLSTILAMVLVAGMLAACGGTPETPSSTAPAETAPSAEPAEEPADDAAPARRSIFRRARHRRRRN